MEIRACFFHDWCLPNVRTILDFCSSEEVSGGQESTDCRSGVKTPNESKCWISRITNIFAQSLLSRVLHLDCTDVTLNSVCRRSSAGVLQPPIEIYRKEEIDYE